MTFYNTWFCLTEIYGVVPGIVIRSTLQLLHYMSWTLFITLFTYFLYVVPMYAVREMLLNGG